MTKTLLGPVNDGRYDNIPVVNELIMDHPATAFEMGEFNINKKYFWVSVVALDENNNMPITILNKPITFVVNRVSGSRMEPVSEVLHYKQNWDTGGSYLDLLSIPLNNYNR